MAPVARIAYAGVPQRGAALEPRTPLGCADFRIQPLFRDAARCRVAGPGVAFVAFPSHIQNMQPDLSPEDCAAIAALLRDTIAADRFPLSPRIKRMRAILNKLDPPVPKPVPFSPLKPPGHRAW